MEIELRELIQEMNPWLGNGDIVPTEIFGYVPRVQSEMLLLPDWDVFWLLLVGPRQAGKTTLGKYLARELVKRKRFAHFLYLNCDFAEIRKWVQSPLFIREAMKEFSLNQPILFLDEVQRLDSPGLLLKGIADLQLPIKMMASGSSQLEMKSQVQEFLTGRHLQATVLPLSYQEIKKVDKEEVVFGCYPGVVLRRQKEILLKQLYQDYIDKDIIEILKVGKPDMMRKLITLIAHSSGQLVNYNQLATDCRTSIPTIQHYCSILEKTYTIHEVKPFVGNKRKEIVANPVYYFIDNGFRNQALRRLSMSAERGDWGLLIESAVFQEILKFREQHFYDFAIYFWRTQSGAEVDFVLHKTEEEFLPIEVKYRLMKRPMVTRSLRSFIEAYRPKEAVVITKNFSAEIRVDGTQIYFFPFEKLEDLFPRIKKNLGLHE